MVTLSEDEFNGAYVHYDTLFFARLSLSSACVYCVWWEVTLISCYTYKHFRCQFNCRIIHRSFIRALTMQASRSWETRWTNASYFFLCAWACVHVFLALVLSLLVLFVSLLLIHLDTFILVQVTSLYTSDLGNRKSRQDRRREREREK